MDVELELRTSLAMTTTAGSIGAWWNRHSNSVLTALALPIAALYALPQGVWSEWVGLPALLTVAAWLPLIIRIRYPFAVLAASAAIDTVQIALIAHRYDATIVPVATILAVYTVTSSRPARFAWPAAAVVAIAQFSTAAAIVTTHDQNLFLYWNWVAVAAIVGQLVQERRRRIATAAERTAEIARREVTAERIRIAHELHDVLAHHIAVVNAQAGVAQYLLDSNPAAAREALAGIVENSKAALDELRSTLGLLRDENHDDDALRPSPGLDQLPALIQGFRDTGMNVRFFSSGDPEPLSASVDLALFRIAQEALTNATKHAPGSDVTIRLQWDAAAVSLTVTDSGRTESSVQAAKLIGEGTGHGLLGMRERAIAAGGSVTAGPLADGGYEVSATLPRVPVPLVNEIGPRP
jgi:signal transduction histidine kinase